MRNAVKLIHKTLKPLSLCALLLAATPVLANFQGNDSPARAVQAGQAAAVKAGVDAWESGDFDGAVRNWRTPALAGDADAQFNLGQAYKLGRGVPMDLDIAQDWFRQAAEQGHIQAEDNYGLILFQSNRREEAMRYIRASADRGEPRAQYVLGTALFNGDLGEKDWVKAYALMTRASAQGVPQAGKSLATMDQYVPMSDRQRGTLLAAELERDANQNRLRLASAPTSGAAEAIAPAAAPIITAARSTSPSTGPIQTASLPPSNAANIATGAAITGGVGADYIGTAPANRTASASASASASATAPLTQIPATSAPNSAANSAIAAAPVATSGAWRVQLGAFGDEANARSLWSTLEGKYSALGTLQPFLVKSGRLTKLQAGPFATADDAKRVCATLSSSGQGCYATKP